MTRLHETISGTWKIIRVIGVIISIWIFIVFANRAYVLYKIAHSPPPPPTAGFGNLPAIVFPSNQPIRHLTFNIDTLSGLLPVFPDREPVYKVVQPQPNLLSFDQIQNMVKNTEFADQQPTALSDTLYMWTMPMSPFKRLTVDIIYRDFTLTSDYISDPTVLAAQGLSDTNSAIQTAHDFFSNLSSYPNTIDETKTNASLFLITGGHLAPADKIANAHLVHVDYYYKDFPGATKDPKDILPVYYSHSPNSIMNALVASGPNGQQIVEAHYTPKTLEAKSETYPLKTPQEAFDDLQAGKSYIVSNGNVGNIINIKDISLGYYMDETRQQYILPIVVFKADNNFLAYVSAVKDILINK